MVFNAINIHWSSVEAPSKSTMQQTALIVFSVSLIVNLSPVGFLAIDTRWSSLEATTVSDETDTECFSHLYYI